jgi:pimeloyl-ACP methyl ester carboxylesterase
MTQPLLQAADLRSAAGLTNDAVAGLTDLVEAMHARITGLPATTAHGSGRDGPVDAQGERTQGIAGLVYETVRGVTRLAGGSTAALLSWLEPALVSTDARRLPHAEREAIVAALNGMLGDYLAATDNPLAIAMAFRQGGRPLTLERFAMRSSLTEATPRLLVLLHGLCVNDLQWRHAGHDHGEALARDLGYTPVYLHYNSGLSVSTNGRILAQCMERLYDAWPVPVQRLVMVGHSMGGLVARSAIHHGALMARGSLRWPTRVDDLVCLGTPHQGTPLGRAEHGMEQLLSAAPYAASLARLSKIRSAGIDDLRLGNIVGGRARETAEGPDTLRCPQVDLPVGTRCFAIAASLGPAVGGLNAKLLGDGLVPLASALGRHDDPARQLAFADDRQAVVHETGHLGLLSSAVVYGLLRRWLH